MVEVETAKNNDSLPECTFLKTSFYPLGTDGSPLRPRESAHFFSPCSSSVSLPEPLKLVSLIVDDIHEGVRSRMSVYTEQELKEEDEGQDEGDREEQRVQV